MFCMSWWEAWLSFGFRDGFWISTFKFNDFHLFILRLSLFYMLWHWFSFESRVPYFYVVCVIYTMICIHTCFERFLTWFHCDMIYVYDFHSIWVEYFYMDELTCSSYDLILDLPSLHSYLHGLSSWMFTLMRIWFDLGFWDYI